MGKTFILPISTLSFQERYRECHQELKLFCVSKAYHEKSRYTIVVKIVIYAKLLRNFCDVFSWRNCSLYYTFSLYQILAKSTQLFRLKFPKLFMISLPLTFFWILRARGLTFPELSITAVLFKYRYRRYSMFWLHVLTFFSDIVASIVYIKIIEVKQCTLQAN